MKIKKASISAVIVVRNEEETIGKVIQESILVLPTIAKKYEILVNDDASTDKTSDILDKFSKKYSYIKVFHQKKPLGISGGFEFLYKQSSNQLVFTNAGDGQYTARDLPKMLHRLNEGYDLVIGKRSNKKHYSPLRKVISYFYNNLPKILFGVELFDAGSNKLYKKDVLEKTNPVSKSVFSEAERIIRAHKLGFKISAVSIHHFARKKETYSTIRLRTILYPLFDIFKLFYIFRKKTFYIISVLIFLIIANQVVSLRPVLLRGMNGGDDWDTLTIYRTYPESPSYLARIARIYQTQSRAYLSQHIYIGTLYEIFGFNPQAYQLVNLFLKIVATISIYPLVLILSRDKIFAFLTTFLYSISIPAAGALTFMVTGQHYLAIIFLNIFGISYYYLLRNQFQNKKTHFSIILISSFLYLFTIIVAPERMFPFLAVPFLIELILIIKIILSKSLNLSSKKNYVLNSLIRLLLFYGMIYLFFFRKTNTTGSLKPYEIFLSFFDKIINQSNWQILLTPFSSLGNMLIDNNLLNNFFSAGNNLQGEALKVLQLKHIIFSAIITLIIAWVIKPKNYFLFYISVIIATIVSSELIIYIVNNATSIPPNFRAFYDLNRLNTTFIGSYYFIIAIIIFIEWLINQRDTKLLLILSLCPFWALLFIFLTMFAGVDTNIDNPIHRYLTIPSLSSSLFISGIIILLHKRLLNLHWLLFKNLSLFMVIILLIPFYYYQITFTYNFFYKDNVISGTTANLQALLKQRLDKALEKSKLTNMLLYIEWHNDPADHSYTFSFFAPLDYIVFYDKKYHLMDGCKAIVYPDISQLKKFTIINNGEISFFKESICVNKSSMGAKRTEFKTSEFQAFLLKNDQFFDIKEETLSKLKP